MKGLEPRRFSQKIIYWISHTFSRIFFMTFGRLDLQGTENIPETGAAIFASNHLSNFDPNLVGSCVKRPIYYFAKEELFRVPILGWWIAQVNAFPVKRLEHDIRAFKKARALLSQGEGVLLFPEGHRSKTGELGPPKPGATVLQATRSQLFHLVLALALTAGALSAQGPLSLEVRAGGAAPVGSFHSRTGAAAGASFGAHFTYVRSARRAFYVGFSQHRFGCREGCLPGGDLVSTGWGLGTRLTLSPLSAVAPWLRAGMVFDRVESRPRADTEGGARTVSDLSLGGEVGGGATVRLGPRLSATPGVRYTLLNTRFREEGLVRMRYLVADLGLVIGF